MHYQERDDDKEGQNSLTNKIAAEQDQPPQDPGITGARTLVKRPPTTYVRGMAWPNALASPLLVVSVLMLSSWLLVANHAQVQRRVLPPASVYANNPVAEVDSSTQDQLHLVIQVPANRWVDTGIDMCGCAHIRVSALGSWETPTGDPTNALGVSHTTTAAAHAALTPAVAYGALVAKVGKDPFVLVGNSRELEGDQFADSGTLELGMNARASEPDAHGHLAVLITGEGSLDHQPTLCETPQP